jgi:hypothetical protein
MREPLLYLRTRLAESLRHPVGNGRDTFGVVQGSAKPELTSGD